MNKLIVSFACLVIFFSGCSSKSNLKKKKKISKKEISEKFDIDEKLLEKFETNDTEEMSSSISVEIEDKNQAKAKKEIKNSISNIEKKQKSKRKKQKEIMAKEPIILNANDEVKNVTVQHPEFLEIDKGSKSIWNLFDSSTLRSFKHKYNISYGLVKAGELTLSLEDHKKKIYGQPVVKFHAQIISNSFYSYIYEVDDNLVSYFSKESFLPIKFQMDQIESNFISKELMLFDHESKTSYFFYQKTNEDKETTKKKKTIKTPVLFQDPFSVLFFLKGIDWNKVGIQRLSIPLVNGKKILILNSHIDKKETLSIMGQDIEALKIKASTKYQGDTLKSGDITFWFSNDEKRDLLKLRIKVKLGSILLEKVKELPLN